MPSSAILHIGYDFDNHELSVTFVTRKTYVYSDVPVAIYEEFLRAASKGQFFNAEIRDRYPYRRLARRA
jgi:hypothetical protein